MKGVIKMIDINNEADIEKIKKYLKFKEISLRLERNTVMSKEQKLKILSDFMFGICTVEFT